MHHLRGVWQKLADLHAVRTGGDGLGAAHGVSPGHAAKGVQVRHAAGHVEIDDALGRGGLLGFAGAFKRRGKSAWRQGAHHGNAEAGLGDGFGKVTTGDIITGMEEGFHEDVA